MVDRRYRLDGAARRYDRVLVGGSPLKLFRVTDAGVRVLDQIAAGETVADTALVAALVDAGAIHPIPTSASHTADDVTIVVPALGAPVNVPSGALVVDDGSDPPIAGAAIRLDRSVGPGSARNAGLGRVTTPLVAFIDTDVTVPDRWLDDLLPHFDDDRVALVAPRVVSTPGSSDIARYESGHSPLDLGLEPARVRAGSRVSYVPAAAIVCRVEAIRAIGGFDEDLRFGEDVDLVWRLDAAGWRVRYEPASVVVHAPRADWLAWARQRVGYGSSTAPLARRHPGALAPIRMSGWSVATWVVGIGVHPLLGASIGATSAAALVRKLDTVPPREAFRLAWLGNVHAGAQLADAIRRVWWPILTIASLRSRFARRVLLAAALASRSPTKLVDDLAFSLGVWRGMIAERTMEPLVPEISSWPGHDSRWQRAVDR